MVLASLQHLHTLSAVPLYNDVVSAVQRRIAHLSITVPQLQHITTDQLRGVLVLLQRAGCVHIHGGPHVNLPITVSLPDRINAFADLRRRHDRYLETLMAEQERGQESGLGLGPGEERTDQLLWPRNPREQMYLKQKVERVASNLRF